MDRIGGFDWRLLGKADYSQACALVASLPAAVRNKLRNGERELLCRITFLCWRFAQTSGRGKGYAIPSERWLGRVIMRSERTVRRCLTVLHRCGLLTWVRRKGAGNTWLSNLYTLGKSFLSSIFARQSKKVQQNHQRTKMADNDLKREYEADAPPSGRGRLTDLLQKLRPDLAFGLGGPRRIGAYEGGN